MKRILINSLLAATWAYASSGLADEATAPVSQQMPQTNQVTDQAGSENPQAKGTQVVETIDIGTTTELRKKPTVKTDNAGPTVTGAFGVTLGDIFSYWMVDKVISKEPITYKDHGENQPEFTGTQYEVIPHISNPHFNRYLVKANKDGVIYQISAIQSPEERTSACRLVKRMGKHLESKYGMPRGSGTLGEWFAFRDLSSEAYRGVRLYGQRCKIGRYELHYGDDGAMMREPTHKRPPHDMAGL